MNPSSFLCLFIFSSLSDLSISVCLYWNGLVITYPGTWSYKPCPLCPLDDKRDRIRNPLKTNACFPSMEGMLALNATQKQNPLYTNECSSTLLLASTTNQSINQTIKQSNSSTAHPRDPRAVRVGRPAENPLAICHISSVHSSSGCYDIP
jgi:hypothetical protein